MTAKAFQSANGSPVVKIRKEIASLIPKFLKNRLSEMDRLREVVAAEDYVELDRLAHTLKGTAGSFGFSDLADVGAQLQSAARSRDSATSLHLVAQAESYLRTVEVFYV